MGRPKDEGFNSTDTGSHAPAIRTRCDHTYADDRSFPFFLVNRSRKQNPNIFEADGSLEVRRSTLEKPAAKQTQSPPPTMSLRRIRTGGRRRVPETKRPAPPTSGIELDPEGAEGLTRRSPSADRQPAVRTSCSKEGPIRRQGVGRESGRDKARFGSMIDASTRCAVDSGWCFALSRGNVASGSDHRGNRFGHDLRKHHVVQQLG